MGADDGTVTAEDEASGAIVRGERTRGPIDPDVLSNAAMRDDVPLIGRLLGADADPDAVGGLDSTPPLHWACWRGRGGAAWALVEAGADIHAVNRYGATRSARPSTAR